MNNRKFIRDFQAGGHLDLFIVTAVAAVLLIRLFLELTGFPQIGGDTLHVAHMLWGGLLMLVALIVLLSFVGRSGHKLAAVLGGAGFGTFIDEVGKFVTQDNDYFFQPSVAIIYVVFVLLYVAVRYIHSGPRRTRLEYLVNALQEVQEVAAGDLDENERDRALGYLRNCDPDQPLALELRDLLSNSTVVSAADPDVFVRIKTAAARLYRWVAARPWFPTAVILFFVGELVVLVVHVFALLVMHTSWLEVLTRRPIDTLGSGTAHLSYFEGTLAVFVALSAVLVALGALRIRRSRLGAFQMFQRSILVSILLIQPLMFYRDQWSALIGLAFDITVFVALRFVIEREQVGADLTPA